MKYLIALASITFREVKGLQILENCASIKFRECPDNYDFAVINSHERPKYSRNRQTFYLQSSFNYQNNINGLSHMDQAVRLRLRSMVCGASLLLSITFSINLQKGETKNIRHSHDNKILVKDAQHSNKKQKIFANDVVQCNPNKR